MIYLLGWLFVLGLVGLWSLTVWMMHAFAAWAVANAGAVAGAGSRDGVLQIPEWLAPWVPPPLVEAFTSMLASLAPVLDWLLQVVPALAGGLTVLTWVIWGFGCVLLILVGGGLHLLLAVWRRRKGDAGVDSVRPARA